MSSPLDEARPTSLDELFSRDPHELTDAELDDIVEELRRAREKWTVLDSEPQARGRPKKPKTTLEDLDLSHLLEEKME